MINIVTLVGRITKDPELRKSKTNKSVVQFTLACEEYVNREKVPYYFDCVVWEQGADYLAQYAKKGNLVGVIGKLTYRDYTAKDGHKVRTYEVIANKVQLLSMNETKKEEPKEEFAEPSFFNAEPKPTNNIVIEADDLPFF